jgi:endonuclease YncB( thermonuclease family)
VPRLRPRRWPAAAGALALGALVAADHKGWLLVRGPDDVAAYHGAEVLVNRVVEGDLLEIAIPDGRAGRPQTQVRLWGVRCPRGAEALADDAAAHTRLLAEGRSVELALEPLRTRGELGRVMAHVRLPDGSNLNERLLAAGLARADDRAPHALLERYDAAERDAKRAKAGVWGEAPRRRSDPGRSRSPRWSGRSVLPLRRSVASSLRRFPAQYW